MLLAQAQQLAAASGGKVVAILLGHNVDGLASDLGADEVWYVDHPELGDFIWANSLAVLEALLAGQSPRLVLFGDTTIGSGLAGGLSARLDLPLVSYCRQIIPADGHFHYLGQICGGKMLVEGALPDSTTLAAMIPGAFRVEQGKSDEKHSATPVPLEGLDDLLAKNSQRYVFKGYTEPAAGDVDITREKILVSVGRGIQSEDNLSLAQDLADALEGAVSGSRPIIDQSWLPTSRLVGKSGKTVKPKVYLALGISGAPEHTEAITGAGAIVAVNTDPSAPIFNLAKYGVQLDLLDLLPVLTERVRAEK